MNVGAHWCAAHSRLISRALRIARGTTLGALLLITLCARTLAGQPDPIQFDVFLGHDGIVPEATWFPVVCEIRNNGPAFTATIEVNGGGYKEGQALSEVVELPTGTLKR